MPGPAYLDKRPFTPDAILTDRMDAQCNNVAMIKPLGIKPKYILLKGTELVRTKS